jgi:hypothetical protein
MEANKIWDFYTERCVYDCTMFEAFLNWSLGHTTLYGFAIYNWTLVIAFIFILWILCLAITSPLKE